MYNSVWYIFTNFPLGRLSTLNDDIEKYPLFIENVKENFQREGSKQLNISLIQ